MKVDVITLFPEMFQALTAYGITGRAVSRGLIDLHFCNPRDYTQDKHRTVDDRPYGGGPGMIMKPEPLLAAIRHTRQQVSGAKVIYLSPQGRPLTQKRVVQLSQESGLILLSGRYEGIDERVCQLEVDEEISIGDYVLSGGELPSMVLLDAIIRILPGALGHPDSAEQDSFSQSDDELLAQGKKGEAKGAEGAQQQNGWLDCPHYTRPENLEGCSVPSVLLSGDHAAIAKWRHQQALKRTEERRPDLLDTTLDTKKH